MSLKRVSAAFLAIGLLSGCANSQYAGVNYGEAILPDGEHWKIAGGKDETNVSFEVTRVDGTNIKYTADNADSSAVLAKLAAVQQQQLQLISTLITKLPVP
ncbi:MAG: hypothetical protein HWD60_08385 [Defluviicoccus sp.]|nr:MAG: hypothetical protein HWD60_08385 [Defluviicoccus sp.]